jgi:hypothetical protein
MDKSPVTEGSIRCKSDAIAKVNWWPREISRVYNYLASRGFTQLKLNTIRALKYYLPS